MNQTIKQLSLKLRKKEISAVELTKEYLANITKYSNLNAFITITAELALKQAAAADNIMLNNNNSLLGIPYAHKDIFCTKGVRTTAGSKMLDNFIPQYNATINNKLNKAGAVMIGKTNMDEFAMGSSNENSFYGSSLNPWDTHKIPGGSSGGSAVAVISNLAVFASATDTGGSIRQPASMCGVTGIKPTYGSISRYGMIAYASSLDQAGIMAKSSEDCAIVLNTITGFDDKDSTSIQQNDIDYTATLEDNINGLKIGIPDEYFTDGLDNGVATKITAAIAEFEKLGAIISKVSLPNLSASIPAYYIIAPCEASSNLSRFDGVRYGYRAKDPIDLEDLYVRSRSEGFGAEVKKRIMVGTYALSEGYYDAYYLKAQKVRSLIANDFAAVFKKVDVIMGPVAPTTAWNLTEIKDSVSMYLSDIYTLSVNLAGLPAMSIPAGLTNNMPVGLHIIANHFCENKLLNIAHKFQQNTDFHILTPKDL